MSALGRLMSGWRRSARQPKRSAVLRFRATDRHTSSSRWPSPDGFAPRSPSTHRPGPYQILAAQLDGSAAVLPAERRPRRDPAPRPRFASLALDGPLRHASAQEREAGLTRVLDNIERGL
jgi:hypothetical protein